MRTFLHLLRSMRFAIAILAVVAVAATTGSILQQSQPAVTYVSSYGEFWAGFFMLCGLTDVYHAWWFFTLLAFMATSTALCLWQNTPSMLRDMRSYREQKSLASLRKLEYTAEFALPADPARQPALASYLSAEGYRYKHVNAHGGSLLAARTGGTRRLGYLLVHSAMVLICVGGLVDGNLLFNSSYRASMNIPEGDTSDVALIQRGDAIVRQQLPFAVKLKEFRIDHYANGQPKDFASDIEIIDGAHSEAVTLQVNHPYTYRGVTLFQSGFADGGSKVALRMLSPGGAKTVAGTVGAGTPLLLNGEPVTIEFSELRAINVFDKDDLPDKAWNSRGKPGERTRDVGPSLSFQLRDKQGQADEWNVFQRRIEIDGAGYLLIGHRPAQETSMRYLRLPVDADGSTSTYTRLSQALNDQQARARAAREVASKVEEKRLSATLEMTSDVLLEGFSREGYRTLARNTDDAKVGQLYMQLIERTATLLLGDGAPAADQRVVRDALAAYNDSIEMALPALFTFDSFEQVNATGLQVTYAPGAALVYLGSALLAMGVICMYFVRERRLWLYSAGGKLLLAFSANRNNPGLQAEFDRHAAAVARMIGGDTSTHMR
jgi:cytochrome c biogenesis protein